MCGIASAFSDLHNFRFAMVISADQAQISDAMGREFKVQSRIRAACSPCWARSAQCIAAHTLLCLEWNLVQRELTPKTCCWQMIGLGDKDEAEKVYPTEGDPSAKLQLVSFPPVREALLSGTPFGGKVEVAMRLAGLEYEAYNGSVTDPRVAPKKKVWPL